MPLGDTRFVVIDCELTGLNKRKDSIVSIGAVRMTGARIEISDSYYKLIKPEANLTAESVVIHEITPSEVCEQPDIRTALADFLRFCGTDVIAGFCVDIDMEFLNRETQKLFGHFMGNPVLDILPVFEWMRQKDIFHKEVSLPGRYTLYDLAKFFEISINGAHNAVIDAFITAQIFQRLIPVLRESGITDMGELIRISNKFKGGDSLSHDISNF